MEDLFKIDKIDGKGLGWIALQDIKAGTLIWKEKDKNLPELLFPRKVLGDQSLLLFKCFCFGFFE